MTHEGRHPEESYMTQVPDNYIRVMGSKQSWQIAPFVTEDKLSFERALASLGPETKRASFCIWKPCPWCRFPLIGECMRGGR